MKYYIILMKCGRVREILSFDEEDARDFAAFKWDKEIEKLGQLCNYDEVQTHTEVT